MRAAEAMAVLAVMTALAVPVHAQGESAAHAALSKEGSEIADSCGAIAKAANCAYMLATANPLHVTFGTLAPGDGVGIGPALVGHNTPNDTWRINWSTDAVVAPGGSWRAGGYLNFVRTAVQAPVPVAGDTVLKPAGQDVYPIYSLFAQAISLNSVGFYGEGPSPDPARKSFWSMHQTMAGGRALVPVGPSSIGLAVVGQLAARGFRVRGHSTDSAPAVDHEFAAAETPGLGDDRTFLQLSVGLRAIPAWGIHVQPTYSVGIDRFIGGSGESFTRWTVDLVHQFPFYGTSRPALPGNTPNDCSTSGDAHACAAPSRNRYGAAAVRLYTVGSPGGATIPFYLQPTLGGSDINGQKLLSAFDDDFFRAPDLLAVQVTAEHSLFALGVGHGIALPFGVVAMVEEGSVGNRWPDVFHRLTHSYAAGLTLRAGGFPEVTLLYAWGPPGHHISATINPALLGAGSRPSLF